MQQSHRRLFLAVIAIVGLILFGAIYLSNQRAATPEPALHIDSTR